MSTEHKYSIPPSNGDVYSQEDIAKMIDLLPEKITYEDTAFIREAVCNNPDINEYMLVIGDVPEKGIYPIKPDEDSSDIAFEMDINLRRKRAGQKCRVVTFDTKKELLYIVVTG